ncbi:MAG: hypothetical protein QM756_10855 [Polyangiaceae bacterium]
MRRALFATTAVLLLLAGACAPAQVPSVSLSFKRSTQNTPWDAGVWIDEDFIGPLNYVAAHGVRLPEGKHRITVQKEGYFPWDQLVVAGKQPIALDVALEPVPD